MFSPAAHSFWIGLFFMYFSASLFAQNNDKAQLKRAKEYIEKAEDFYAQAQYESSIKEYQFAGRIYRETNHPEKYGICYNGIGNNYIDMTLYTEAYTEFGRVLTHFDELAAIDDSLAIDSSIIADAYEGFGRFYMNVQENLMDKNRKKEKAINFETALHYHQLAFNLRLKLYGEEHPKTALSYYFMGLCLKNLPLDTTQNKENPNYENPIKKGLLYLEKALAIQEKTLGKDNYHVADTYNELGHYAYEVSRDYQKGVEYHEKALKIRQKIFENTHPKIADSYIGLATYYRVLNIFDQELTYLEKALQIRLNILGEKHTDIAKNYYLLGNRYRFSGDIEKALSYFEQAIAIYIELQGELSVEVADAYQSIALCYQELEKKNKERLFLERALKIRKKIFGEQHFKVGESYMALGTYFGTHIRNEQKGYDSLQHYYGLAMEIWTKQLGEDHYLIAKLYDKLAAACQFKGDMEKEFEYLNKALDMKKKRVGGEDRSRYDSYEADMDFSEGKKETFGYQLFDSYLHLSDFYRRKKDYYLALVYCQNALSAVTNSLSEGESNIYKNPSNQDLSHNIAWLEALQYKAELCRLKYAEKKDRKDIDFALETYEQALELVDTLRIKFSSDGAKEQLSHRSIPIYEGAINAYYELYQIEQKVEYLDRIFEVMERSKAFVLLQALQSIRAKGFGGVPGELLAEVENLHQSLTYYSNAQNRDKESSETFQKKYFEKKRAHDSLVRTIEQRYPKYFAMKYRNEVSSIKEIQKDVLGGQDALLEYFIGDEYLYAFCITKEKSNLYRLPMTKDFGKRVRGLRGALTDEKSVAEEPKAAFKHFVNSSHAFYKGFFNNFLEEIDEGVDRLILIPDGLLSYIPFEVLVSEPPQSLETVDYQSLNYILHDYQINYSYSATLLRENLLQGQLTNNGKCLGFAPTYRNSTAAEAAAELPWAEKEMRAIESIFSGDYYYGIGATKDVFLSKGPEFGIIHLAMHGVVNFQNPLKSKLAFTQQKETSEDQAFLYAYEVHNMELNADLVVLSACETGFGKALRGEGVLSLARAFMYAGTPSVVTTLWKVNDYTSATIMTYFYDNLSRGMRKPEALQKAKLRYLKNADPNSGHPIFWASFVSIGDPAPIRAAWTVWAWGGFMLLLGGIGGAFFWMWKRKKQNLIVANYHTVAEIVEPVAEPVKETVEESTDEELEEVAKTEENPTDTEELPQKNPADADETII